MKVLFISRAFPPIVGGIEKHNEQLLSQLKSHIDTVPLVNTRGKAFLPIFLPLALIRSLFALRKMDAVVFGDTLPIIIAPVLKFFYPSVKFVAVAHGLDITFNNKIYQTLVVDYCTTRIDRFISVSRSTKQVMAARGISEEKISVVPNGVETFSLTHSSKSETPRTDDVLSQWSGKHILLSLGRLVKRKGVLWFLQNVFPNLNDQYVYIIAGAGPEHSAIEAHIINNALHHRVVMLGNVSEEEKRALLSGATMFVQPNIPVEGDMEGFGITVLEAGAHQLPVLASELEGLQDSVVEGQNGWHCPPLNASAFQEAIEHHTSEALSPVFRESIPEFIRSTFDWKNIGNRYVQEIYDVVHKKLE